MFILKLKTVDGNIEYVETEKYKFSSMAECHPAILEATLYSGTTGKRLHTLKRRFQRYYIKHKYKPVQQELTPEGAEPAPANH